MTDYKVFFFFFNQAGIWGDLMVAELDRQSQLPCLKDFPGGSDGKESMQETQVRSWGGEDLLEEDMLTHSSILAWGIP